MSRDVDVILKAIQNSSLVEISADRTKIRRRLISNPVPGNNASYSKNDQKARTIYVEGFSPDTDIKSLIEHFETAYPVEYVFLEKDKSLFNTYEFNRSLYLQFKTLYDAKKFMEETSTEYKDNLLTKSWAPESYYVGKV